MKSRHRVGSIRTIGIFLVMATCAGCTPSYQMDRHRFQAVNTDQVIADLRPHIERLHLSWHELNQAYKDIRFLERGFLFDSDDRQLGYIHKASLYVQDTVVRIRHQWERLSVLHYIRPEMMRDYLTLSVNGLTSAIDEIGYDERFLIIYGAFITHDAVTADLNRARAHIKTNTAVLNQILERLVPMANSTTLPVIL